MTVEEFLKEYKERPVLPLMETDCVLTALLYEGRVKNY